MSVAATGSTFRWKEHLFQELCTVGTAVFMTTVETTRPHPRVAPCTWLTAAHGPTATQRALLSETRPQDRRWMSSSFSCIWALTCRRWLSSRAWTLANYWECLVVTVKHHGHRWTSYLLRWHILHLAVTYLWTMTFYPEVFPYLTGTPTSWITFCFPLEDFFFPLFSTDLK